MRIFVTYLFIIIGISLFFSKSSASSTQFQITGTVVDSQSKKSVYQAHIINNNRAIAITDSSGMFQITCQINDTITISHTAFEVKTIVINKELTNKLKIELSPVVHQTQEVTITAQTLTLNQRSNTGVHRISNKDILKTPEFLGEPDVLQTLKQLPGIQAVNEGNSGIYVRGGSAGQNYVIFDNIELLNPSHVMGIFSVFNPLLTRNVELYKGTAPVHLSSRQASTIIVDTYSTPSDYNWSGNIGTISSNLTFNKASKNQKWYYQMGIRRSFVELYKSAASLIINDKKNYFSSNNYRFFDFNGKIKYQSDKDKITLSWYKGGDKFNISRVNLLSDITWGNEGAALTWLRLLSENVSMNTTLSYSGYKSSFAADMPNGHIDLTSSYSHLRESSNFTWTLNRHLIKYGLQTTHYFISPQKLNMSLTTNERNAIYKYKSYDSKVYISDSYTITDRWKAYAGTSISYYNLYNVSQENGVANTTKPTTQNITFNPHIDIVFKPTNSNAIKASYTYTNQNLHYATIAAIPIPSDIWMPATANLTTTFGDQITLGYFKQLHKINGEFGVDVYGKRMNNLIILKVNTDNNNVSSFDDIFSMGDGYAFGSEFMLRGHSKKLDAQLSYTLGWVRHQFDDLNQGKWFDATQDRRHDLSIQISYKLNNRIDINSIFMYATGNKATLATGRYWLLDGNIANDYAGLNNFRMPSYNRLDLSISYLLKSTTFKESKLNFSIINVYNRSNPFFIYYVIEKPTETKYKLSIKAKQVSLFPLMPSVSWRFKF